MRYKVCLCYNGADFCGWQRQPDAPTIQQSLEESLSKLLGTPTAVTGAGRTDTGVNSGMYVAHFDARDDIDCAQICYKLNAILPRSVAIRSVNPVDDSFHARFDATKREYTYFLHRRKDPFIDKFSYLYAYPQLDFDEMNRAAAMLLGTHDFSCFEKSGGDNKTSVCTVTEARWEKYIPSHISVMAGSSSEGSRAVAEADGCYWYFRISADRFLRNMVRATVGTLLEVGRGKRSAESVASLVENGTRCDAGESVPGYALFLSDVSY